MVVAFEARPCSRPLMFYGAKIFGLSHECTVIDDCQLFFALFCHGRGTPALLLETRPGHALIMIDGRCRGGVGEGARLGCNKGQCERERARARARVREEEEEEEEEGLFKADAVNEEEQAEQEGSLLTSNE